MSVNTRIRTRELQKCHATMRIRTQDLQNATLPRGFEPRTHENARIRPQATTSEVTIGPKSVGASFVNEIGSFDINSVVIFRAECSKRCAFFDLTTLFIDKFSMYQQKHLDRIKKLSAERASFFRMLSGTSFPSTRKCGWSKLCACVRPRSFKKYRRNGG